MLEIRSLTQWYSVPIQLHKGFLHPFFLFSLIVTSIVYPISTHWCWGVGGWLSSMGFYDFAGSGVVHVSGGIHALIGKS